MPRLWLFVSGGVITGVVGTMRSVFAAMVLMELLGATRAFKFLTLAGNEQTARDSKCYQKEFHHPPDLTDLP